MSKKDKLSALLELAKEMDGDIHWACCHDMKHKIKNAPLKDCLDNLKHPVQCKSFRSGVQKAYGIMKQLKLVGLTVEEFIVYRNLKE